MALVAWPPRTVLPMNYVACPDCQHEVSSDEVYCLACGRSIIASRPTNRRLELTGLLMVVLGIAIPISLCFTSLEMSGLQVAGVVGLLSIIAGMSVFVAGRFM